MLVALLAVPGSPTFAADDDLMAFFLADRVEVSDGEGDYLWDVQGWAGGDYHRLWLKSEGDRHEAELQLLYSRAVSPFFDLQLGIRHDLDPRPSRSHAVVGLQGLAPHWFEVDAALFLSDEGVLSARLEAEYDLRLTQRLILQPRAETEAGFGDDDELGLGRGVRQLDLSLRLRYEIRRKLAPYLGFGWRRAFGDTADFLELDGEDSSGYFAVAGLRFWF
ncbi:MAG: copper resistance protein B [Gammaproteobacteria bacterium]|nr:copper resistance protein B [Gammaproteobacteria bacterium]